MIELNKIRDKGSVINSADRLSIEHTWRDDIYSLYQSKAIANLSLGVWIVFIITDRRFLDIPGVVVLGFCSIHFTVTLAGL